MKLWMLRMGLSLMMVVGFWTNRLPAQQVTVVPAVPYEPALHPYAPLPFAPRPWPEPAEHPVRRLLNHGGLGCVANPDGACGDWREDYRFIFGSCRAFFGEPCVPHQPHAIRRWWR